MGKYYKHRLHLWWRAHKCAVTSDSVGKGDKYWLHLGSETYKWVDVAISMVLPSDGVGKAFKHRLLLW